MVRRLIEDRRRHGKEHTVTNTVSYPPDTQLRARWVTGPKRHFSVAESGMILGWLERTRLTLRAPQLSKASEKFDRPP